MIPLLSIVGKHGLQGVATASLSQAARAATSICCATVGGCLILVQASLWALVTHPVHKLDAVQPYFSGCRPSLAFAS